jgi:hypothetical protein
MRWLLTSGLSGYMPCGSIQTSLFQVRFNLKYSSIGRNLSYISKSEWVFKGSNLIGLTWNLAYMLYTYVISCCANFIWIE